MSQLDQQMETDNNIKWQKNTILFLATQTISLLGSAIVQFAIMWHITLTTQSGVMMTIYIVCGFVPSVFLSPIAGVWADRYNRRVLIILADALIAIATLILVILFAMGFETIWLLFVMAAVRAMGTGIQAPAVGAILPQIVPASQLTKVNGINGSIQAIVNLISPMISALLLTITALETIFLVDVITAVIAIFILTLFLPIPIHAKALQKQTTSYLSDLRQGFKYIEDHQFLKKFFMFFAVFLVLIAPAAFLTPLQVARSFGSDVWRLTALEITFSIGMMLGGIVMVSWGGFSNKVHTMTLASLLFGICTFALGITPVFVIYLVFMGITGVAMPLFNTPATVLLQEQVEEDYMGRVFGVLGMISTSMMPLGMLIFGPMADMIKIEWIFMGTGTLLFLQGLLLLSNKTLVEAGKKS
ncbi:MAG: MFS transporter [Firmicutes bacterium]|nr:MFS transporter [Bacillota bacterium]